MTSPSSLLVYFYKSEGDVSNFAVPFEVQGLVGSKVLHDGRTIEYSFSSPEVQFNHDLKTALEREGLNQFCTVSSQLSEDNNVCVLSVEGMTCNSCVKLIESTMIQVAGVQAIKVSLQFKEAFIEYKQSVVKPATLAESIYDMGFDATVAATFGPASSAHSAGPLLHDHPRPSLIHGTPLNPDEATPLSAHPIVVIDVEGMTCSSCVQNIESNISKERGVVSIKVSLQAKNAAITFDESLTTPKKLADAIDELGFETKLIGNNLVSPASLTGSGKDVGHLKVCYMGIDGMTCMSCVSLIESVIGELEGVVSINVSLSCKEGTLEFNDALTSPKIVSKAVEDMGFLVTYTTGNIRWLYVLVLGTLMYMCIFSLDKSTASNGSASRHAITATNVPNTGTESDGQDSEKPLLKNSTFGGKKLFRKKKVRL